jgi:hypothetical protein
LRARQCKTLNDIGRKGEASLNPISLDGKTRRCRADWQKSEVFLREARGGNASGQIFTGPYAGQFLAAARFPEWETCGKAMQAMSTDAEYQSILAEAQQVAELHGRSIVVSLDL